MVALKIWLSWNKIVLFLLFFFRKLCSLPEGRVVVQLLRTFKFEWSLVQRRTLPQPLPRWSLLGRVQGRSLFPKESRHDDPSKPQHLPLINTGTHTEQHFSSNQTLAIISNSPQTKKPDPESAILKYQGDSAIPKNVIIVFFYLFVFLSLSFLYGTCKECLLLRSYFWLHLGEWVGGLMFFPFLV